MPVKVEESLRQLRSHGYALWAGAGVTIQLARAGGVAVPDWGKLVGEVEILAGVGSAPDKTSFPERLDVCLRNMERETFQKALKTNILDKLKESILQAARSRHNLEDPIPSEFRQIASLGHLANPIVNFNIECFTSAALAAPGGPYIIRAFNPAPQRSQISSGSISSERFNRAVYHPHGALDIYGLCVMCERDYKTLNGTLALQLAAHAAFESNLAIVGMSLEDDYLRKQIADFRHHIRRIVWFRSDPPDVETTRWAWRNAVEIAVQPWSAFWSATSSLPSPDEIALTQAWMGLVSRAFSSPLHEHSIPFLRSHTSNLNDIMPFLQTAMNQGEEINLNLLTGQPELKYPSESMIPIAPDSPHALLVPLLKRIYRLSCRKEDTCAISSLDS